MMYKAMFGKTTRFQSTFQYRQALVNHPNAGEREWEFQMLDSSYLESDQPFWRHGQEEIVFTGLAVRLPESDTVDEFAQHLFNKDDMLTEVSSIVLSASSNPSPWAGANQLLFGAIPPPSAQDE